MDKSFYKILEGYKPFCELKDELKENKKNNIVSVNGLTSGSMTHITASLTYALDKPSVLVCKNINEAEKIRNMAEFFGIDVYLLHPHEFVYYEIYAKSENEKRELIMFYEAFYNKRKGLYILTPNAFLTPVPKKELIEKNCFTIKIGDEIPTKKLGELLSYYERTDVTEAQGQYSIRGGIADIFPYTSNKPYRIEFFGDEVDSIRVFDPITKLSEKKIDEAYITNLSEYMVSDPKIFSEKLQKLSEKSENSAIKETLERDKDRILTDGGLYCYDRYFPLISDDLAMLSDYIDSDFSVFADDPNAIYENMENMYAEHSEYIVDLVSKGTVIKENAEFFKSPIDDFLKLYRNTVVHFGFIRDNFAHKIPKKRVEIPVKEIFSSSRSMNTFSEEINDYLNDGYFVLIPGRSEQKAQRLSFTLSNYDITAPVSVEFSEVKKGVHILPKSGFNEGFSYPDLKFAFFSDIYMNERKPKKHKAVKNENAIMNFSDLAVGDYVVHPVHGIGEYLGIARLKIENEQKDLIKIKYFGDDYLYIPVNQLNTLYKYIGAEEKTVRLNRLGGAEFDKVKRSVKKSCADLADKLIELYKKRELAQGFRYLPDDDLQMQFERTFPYEETADQLNCIDEVKKDMESDKPMDRLVCGDVGYGKTEIAMRAAFKAVLSGKQVAYLAPTTVLANQHYNTFIKRMSDFSVNVRHLSRFCSKKEISETIKQLKSGECDIVIGTHRLLSKDVEFKDLGLLIIDEEQRFGVRHKEKIKEMKTGIDILTLSATPIPRTLNMAMMGIRDVSTLKEPPCDRHPVRTYVMEYNPAVVYDAIKKELMRNGQVFYLYNRVDSIYSAAKKISDMFPDKTVEVAHGKLSREQMEDIFYRMSLGEVDILVCTTIIETGIDIPNVNTMIIENADYFGLSQLYQLRGRVGRSSRLAYCYLTYRQNKSISEISEKRLRAIKGFTEFGSGFKIAVRDLEIRGAGNILGAEQHGHMGAVGYDMYLQLLDEAVKERRGETVKPKTACQVDLKVSAFIPDTYISDHNTKLEIYKKISLIENKDDMSELENELQDRFSKIPKETLNLIYISYIRTLCEKINIYDVGEFSGTVTFKMTEITNEFVKSVLSADRKYKGKILFGAGAKPYFSLKTVTLDKAKEIMEFLEKILNLCYN